MDWRFGQQLLVKKKMNNIWEEEEVYEDKIDKNYDDSEDTAEISFTTEWVRYLDASSHTFKTFNSRCAVKYLMEIDLQNIVSGKKFTGVDRCLHTSARRNYFHMLVVRILRKVSLTLRKT